MAAGDGATTAAGGAAIAGAESGVPASQAPVRLPLMAAVALGSVLGEQRWGQVVWVARRASWSTAS